MSFELLKKVYYKSPDAYESEYRVRFNSPYTHQFPIDIKEYNHVHSYPAFIGYSEEIVLLLQNIYQKYSKLIRNIAIYPPIMIKTYSAYCMISEIQSTNEIEGVRSTKHQIQNIFQKKSVPKHIHHLISLVKTYEKILNQNDTHFDTCQDIRKFYEDFVLEEVLQENPNNAIDGKIFRKESVDITSATSKTKHQGVFPESAIIQDMTTALGILHDDSIPVLIRLSLFHYFFEYIHPFYDGNGRTGRFIISQYLAKEFHPIIAFQFSAIINKQKGKYYKLFAETESEPNRGELTYFTIGFLQFIEQSFSEVLVQLDRKYIQLRRFGDSLIKYLQLNDPLMKDIYYILLQASLFLGIGVTMEDFINTTHKNKVTIRKRLDQIPADHILIDTSHKPYRYRLNMKIFMQQKIFPVTEITENK